MPKVYLVLLTFGPVKIILKYRQLALILGFGLFTLAGCDWMGNSKGESEIKPVEFETKEVIHKIGQDCIDELSCFDLKLSFPELNKVDTPISKIIQDTIDHLILTPIFEDKVYQNQDELYADIEQAYNEFKLDFPEVESNWFLNRDIKIIAQRDGIITLSFYESSYLGGAHANEMTFYKHYNGTNGKVVLLENFFTTSQRTQLNKLGEQAFRSKRGIEPGTSLEESGFWFKEDQFKLNDNFYFDNTGIYFYFNAYEIAPYSYGSTEIFIPKEAYESI